MKKETAVVFDVSASIDLVLDLFVSSGAYGVEPVGFPLRSGGTLVDPINELAAKYHKLYWFTDGYHSGDLADNVKVILVGRESGYTTNNVTPHEKEKKA